MTVMIAKGDVEGPRPACLGIRVALDWETVDTSMVADDIPHFQIPLNLPHAGRIAGRIQLLLDREGVPGPETERIAEKLAALLQPYFHSEENPPPPLAARVREQAAMLGRQLVERIEGGRLGHDRLGQCIRNLFECLELGCEGAILSLRAGENPGSFQRPA